MSADEERAARKARILARGADRLALLKGELRTFPADSPSKPLLSAVVDARSEQGAAGTDTAAPSAAASVDGVFAAAPAPEPSSAPLSVDSAAIPTALIPPAPVPSAAASSPLEPQGDQAVNRLAEDGIRQRFVPTPAPAPVKASSASAAPAVPAPAKPSPASPASAPPVSSPALSKPAPTPAAPGSAVARAARAARLRSLRAASPCVIGFLAPGLCGALLAATWVWGCDGRPVLGASVAAAAAGAGAMRGADFGALSSATLRTAADHLLAGGLFFGGGGGAEGVASSAGAGRWLLEQRYGSPAAAAAAAAAEAGGADAALDLGPGSVYGEQWWRGSSSEASAASPLLSGLCRQSDAATAAAPPWALPLILVVLALCRVSLQAAWAAAERRLEDHPAPAPPAAPPAAAASPASARPAAAAKPASGRSAPGSAAADERMLADALAEVMGGEAGKAGAASALAAAPPAPAAPQGGGGGWLALALRHGPRALAAAHFGGRLLADACAATVAFVVTSSALEAAVSP